MHLGSSVILKLLHGNKKKSRRFSCESQSGLLEAELCPGCLRMLGFPSLIRGPVNSLKNSPITLSWNTTDLHSAVYKHFHFLTSLIVDCRTSSRDETSQSHCKGATQVCRLRGLTQSSLAPNSCFSFLLYSRFYRIWKPSRQFGDQSWKSIDSFKQNQICIWFRAASFSLLIKEEENKHKCYKAFQDIKGSETEKLYNNSMK